MKVDTKGNQHMDNETSIVEYITKSSFGKEETAIYDTAAERAMLACIMKRGELMHEAVGLVKTTDIYNPYNGFIYRVMKYLYDRQSKTGVKASYDVMSMLSAAKELVNGEESRVSDFINRSGGMDHLKAIENAPISVESFRQYVETVLQRSVRVIAYRQARQIQIDALNANGLTRGEFVSKVESGVLSVSTGRHDDAIVHIGSAARSFVKDWARNKGENKTGVWVKFMPGLMTVLNGLRRKQLIIMFARPKTGKSALFLNIAIDLACMQNIPTLYIDTEMSQEEQLSRTIARWADVDEWSILNGTFNDNQDTASRIATIVDKLESAPFYYSAARGISKEELVSRIRQFKVQHVGEEEIEGRVRTKPCLVIYDWLKVSDSDTIQNVKEYQELGFIATAIKDVGSELDIPILAAAQANRGGIMKGLALRSAEQAQAFVADSDRLLRYASCLMWLRKLCGEESDLIREIDPKFYFNQMLYVIDQRQGPTCLEGIPLFFEAPRIKYNEAEVPNEVIKAIEAGKKIVAIGGNAQENGEKTDGTKDSGF